MKRHAVVADSIRSAPGADTVIIEDGRIVDLTRRSEVGDMDVSVYAGAEILPTFTDSHIHPVGYAALVAGTSVMGAETLEDLRDLLGVAATRTPSGHLVIAQRLDDTRLGRLPTRRDLDLAVPDRPTIVYRYCGHVAVVNTAALDLVGVGPDTPDPAGGSYDRDPDGMPTGVLRETALDHVADALAPLEPALKDDHVLAAMHGLAALGIGHIGGIVAATQGLWCGVGDELGVLCRLAPDLPIDLDLMVIADDAAALREAQRRIDTAGARLRFWGWKDFADGSLGGRTAAMREPFTDLATTGTLRLDPDHAGTMARTALELGGVAAIHAIGDRAIDETLDVYDRLLEAGTEPERLRVEHVSVPSDEAIRRLAASGVVASIQPSFLTSESDWVPARLGRDRSAYPFRTMAEAGVTMIGGSDCPVERPDPLAGIAAAVRRPGWDDDQNLSVYQAVDLFTTAPARHFDRPEPLVPGSPADFVIVAGEVGTETAPPEAVYRGGVTIDLDPVDWPG